MCAHWPERMKLLCAGCNKTRWFVLQEIRGVKFYACAGDPRTQENGCGHRVDVKDDKPEEQRTAEQWD